LKLQPHSSTNQQAFDWLKTNDLDAIDPGTFFIFTPEDAHRPGIQVAGYESVKKVVVKVRTKNPV
jgi:YhcH/YjgK/YiaL family protein